MFTTTDNYTMPEYQCCLCKIVKANCTRKCHKCGSPERRICDYCYGTRNKCDDCYENRVEENNQKPSVTPRKRKVSFAESGSHDGSLVTSSNSRVENQPHQQPADTSTTSVTAHQHQNEVMNNVALPPQHKKPGKETERCTAVMMPPQQQPPVTTTTTATTVVVQQQQQQGESSTMSAVALLQNKQSHETVNIAADKTVNSAPTNAAIILQALKRSQMEAASAAAKNYLRQQQWV